jgi:hypothetical protein
MSRQTLWHRSQLGPGHFLFQNHSIREKSDHGAAKKLIMGPAATLGERNRVERGPSPGRRNLLELGQGASYGTRELSRNCIRPLKLPYVGWAAATTPHAAGSAEKTAHGRYFTQSWHRDARLCWDVVWPLPTATGVVPQPSKAAGVAPRGRAAVNTARPCAERSKKLIMALIVIILCRYAL